ncbi:hypothetical protein G9C98_005777 [Cotesia typhae]|uniref:Uncharacterized protein n=1 Tax=Cotesia typhae TaxID=2053667 RepID=A0A8J5QZC4_9HYME|nr:hypothetical protein G9C98_005777 [Cotesia typhae]
MDQQQHDIPIVTGNSHICTKANTTTASGNTRNAQLSTTDVYCAASATRVQCKSSSFAAYVTSSDH